VVIWRRVPSLSEGKDLGAVVLPGDIRDLQCVAHPLARNPAMHPATSSRIARYHSAPATQKTSSSTGRSTALKMWASSKSHRPHRGVDSGTPHRSSALPGAPPGTLHRPPGPPVLGELPGDRMACTCPRRSTPWFWQWTRSRRSRLIRTAPCLPILPATPEPASGLVGLLPTSLSDDQAAPLHEHGSAAVDDNDADCSAVLADPDWAIYRRVKMVRLLTVRDRPRVDRRAQSRRSGRLCRCAV
jgi:hypothetical protein